MDVESGTASQGVATSSKDKISKVSTVPKFANFYHVYALAMAMTLGGIHTDWSYGLQNGFFIFLIGFFVISIGHISLVLCSAEMTGILPFSGGAYGFARVTLGPYIGYIVGYCDAYRCLTYVMRRLFTFGRMMELATDAPHNLQPLFWLLFFIPCILVDSLGSKSFWGLISFFGGVSLLVTILYFLAASPKMDFDTYVLEQRDKLDLNVDFEGFLFASLSASRTYLGLAQLTLSCEETKEVLCVVCCFLVLLFAT
jgi:amino acid permease